MGAVLTAEDLRLGRTVAMKVMLTQQADPSEQERFHQEARVLGRLAHPNIVPIHDVGMDAGGRHFYTMKLVEGTTLHDILHRVAKEDPEALEKYSLNNLLTIFQKVCDAIGFAHSRGIIHRDLKPQNIMVGAFGEVLVMDWGLAKIVSHEDFGGAGTEEMDPDSNAGRSGNFDPITTPGKNTEVSTVVDGDAPTLVENDRTIKPDGWDGVDVSTEDVAPLLAEAVEVDGNASTVVEGDPSSDAATVAESLDNDAAGIRQLDKEAELGQLTLEGAVMGTPNFMSPEQAAGKISELDVRSDIFSLGGVLYSILTLRPPVRGASMEEILGKVQSGTIVEPTQYNSPGLIKKARASLKGEVADAETIKVPHCPNGKVPARMSAVVMKALRKEPERRYQTVEDFSADIAAYQGGFATSAEEAGIFTLLHLFIQRHRTIAIAILIGIVAAIAFMVELMAKERRARTAEQTAVQEKELQRQEFAKAQTALGEAAIREMDGAKARLLLAEVPTDLRGSDWRYLNKQADTSVNTVFSDGEINVLAMEPYRDVAGVFAVACSDGRVRIVKAEGQEPMLEFPTTFGEDVESPFTMSVSATGGELAIANWDSSKVVFHNTITGAKLREWEASRPWKIECSPTRNHLLFSPEPVSGQPVQLKLYDSKTGQTLWTYDPGVDWMLAAFTPDGQHVVVALGDVEAMLLDAQTGKELAALPETGPRVYRIAISQDGVLAAFGDGQGGVTVMDLQERLSVTSFRAGENIIRLLAFAPDGGRLVTLTYPPNHSFHHIRVWHAITGHGLQSLLGVSRNSRNAALHPYTGELLVAGDETKAWTLGQPEPLWYAESGINPPLARFWPDGNSLLLNDPTGVPQLLEVNADGSMKTNWQADVVCGRASVVSANERYAVIGGASFDLSETVYFMLEKTGTNVSQVGRWKQDEPFAFLRLAAKGQKLLSEGVVESSLPFTVPASFMPEGEWDLGAWLGTNRMVLVSRSQNRSRLTLAESTDGKATKTIDIGSEIYVLTTSTDGRLIAEGGQDRLVRLRDAESLEVKHEFRAHDAAVTALALHPTRPLIATASEDLTVRLWNYETGEMRDELRGPPVKGLDFSPDGTRLMTVGVESLAFVWALPALQAADK